MADKINKEVEMPVSVPVNWKTIQRAIRANETLIVAALVLVAWFQYQMSIQLNLMAETQSGMSERISGIEISMQDPIVKAGSNAVAINQIRQEITDLMETENANFVFTSRQIAVLAEQIAIQPLIVERDTKRVTLNGLQRDIAKLKDAGSAVPESFLAQVQDITNRILDIEDEIKRIRSYGSKQSVESVINGTNGQAH